MYFIHQHLVIVQTDQNNTTLKINRQFGYKIHNDLV